MFYTFNQNNSGGSFHYDPNVGISHFVVIEADNAVEANARAESIGLYFDGWGDCSCCGDRWYSVEDGEYGDGTETPQYSDREIIPGDSYEKGNPDGWGKWINGDEAFIHYANGDILGAWH